MDQTPVARCNSCGEQYHFVSQRNRKLNCEKCGHALEVKSLEPIYGTLMQAIARSAVFPPAPLRVPRWRIA
ncbi:MAG TPA: hypothetical protein VJU84_08780 [Pyrinomonadaceae bacterium]|nr:hypothetical protein [Pyrinomonadaceae bacterium]